MGGGEIVEVLHIRGSFGIKFHVLYFIFFFLYFMWPLHFLFFLGFPLLVFLPEPFTNPLTGSKSPPEAPLLNPLEPHPLPHAMPLG